ncbi:DUF998 domain-containing protein [Nesterenkonia sp. PF2B19]|uniref:DUF998 domain-containing protein n=1 Tax=unclassified Nesterenkonia TaxID=2629769 RepID=UPI0008720CB5|nr:DUF998 domain-containing protein [Nesterenkonia sp. PF2B19]OSM43423.1 hypothetical protein BCY76_008405 [Nesterenkonia sp. PF2B19]
MSSLLLGAPLFGAVLFIAVFLIDGATRPGYDPRRQPVSALALSSRGWVQTANFLQLGSALILGASVLIRQAFSGVSGSDVPWADLIWAGGVAVLGLAVVASGLFRMDPMRGYPPGSPAGDPEVLSRRHRRHDQAGSVVFLGLPVVMIGVVVVPGLDTAVRVAAVVAGLATGWLAVRFGERWEQDAGDAGLWQRAHLVLGLPSLGAVVLAVG